VTRKVIQKFAVPFEYPVYFTRGVLDPANPVLTEAISRREPARRHRVFVIVDSGVADARPRLADELAEYVEAYRANLELAAAPEVLAGGEHVKGDVGALRHLLTRLRERALDRQSCVVVIGGGAVQDMAGYAAAIAHRGLRIVRLPTTVASQNDSGVGVKNGMNAFGAKNFVGTFHPPFAVIDDIDFLRTLPTRERVAGTSEAVKVALIRDRSFFEWLEANAQALTVFAPDAVEYMIRRSAELHLEHIATSGDPFEFGSAKPLDYGHWVAHELESLTDYEIRHGEAVAVGMAVDARYACETGLLAERDVTRICALLERLGLVLWHDALTWRDKDGRLRVLDGLVEFREHLGGELVVTMLEAIGRARDVHEVDEPMVARAIGWLERRARPAA
jgi:3-dehydroquinate synthase